MNFEEWEKKAMGDKNKLEMHQEICSELSEIYRKKNAAYGDSFGKTYRELGIISAVTRMEDKMNRIVSLATGTKNEVADESIKDTLGDLANYAIMTLIEIKGEQKKKESAPEGKVTMPPYKTCVECKESGTLQFCKDRATGYVCPNLKKEKKPCA